MSTDVPLRVHWIRHGRVTSHRGDIPLTDEGLREVQMAGQRLAKECNDSEIVTLLHAPTRRTRETAVMLQQSMIAALEETQDLHVTLPPPLENEAIRNPDLYIGGVRVEMVSSAEALAEQLPLSHRISTQALAQLPFLHGFWGTPDRIGYWVNHANPPGEDADTVARRLLTFATSLLDLPREQPRLYLCVTHSGPMRAFLRRYLLNYDPGEPEYAESVALNFDASGSCTVHWREHHRAFSVLP